MRVFTSETYFRSENHLTKHLQERGIKTEYTSVWLRKNEFAKIEIFYCYRCRFPILQYSGDVVTILPSDIESNLPILVQCRGKECGLKYHFHIMQ